MEDIRHSFSNSSSHDTTPWKSVPVLSFAPLPSPSTTPHRAISSLSPTSPCHISRSQGFHCSLATSPSSKVKSPRRRRSQGKNFQIINYIFLVSIEKYKTTDGKQGILYPKCCTCSGQLSISHREWIKRKAFSWALLTLVYYKKIYIYIDRGEEIMIYGNLRQVKMRWNF